MPRIVLVPGLGLDARSSARLRRRLTADVVLLPGRLSLAPWSRRHRTPGSWSSRGPRT